MEEPCPGRGRQLLRLVGGEEKDTGKKDTVEESIISA